MSDTKNLNNTTITFTRGGINTARRELCRDNAEYHANTPNEV